MARIREFDTDAATEAAMVAFRERGFEGTSVQDLVDATGVGRGSLYAAFGSKEGLYLAAVDRYRQRYAVPLVELLRCGGPVRDLVREVMVDLVDEIVRDGNRLACLVVSAATERARHDGQVAERLLALTRSLEDALTDVIAEAQARGEVSTDRDARDRARFLLTTMQGIRVMGAIDPDRAHLTASADMALMVLD
jgi:TetR/AcrR family transcriptional repressor of nem operon